MADVVESSPPAMILFCSLAVAPSAEDAVMLSWSPPPWATFFMLLAALVYIRGWRLLNRQAPSRFPAWRMSCYLCGLSILWVAIASPLDGFAGLLFQVHMVQHVLLMMVAPPLILLGSPMLPMLRGLPRSWVRDGLGPFLSAPSLRRAGRFLTHPLFTLPVYAAATLLWHWPPSYELALRSEFWHGLEHATFIATGILFWWPVVLPWPSRAQMPGWGRVVYLLVADMFNTLVGGFLTFINEPLYPSYAVTAPLFGISALDDQASAGAIMWVPGQIAYFVPATLIAISLLMPQRGVRPSQLHRSSRARSRPAVAKNAGLFDLLALPLLGRVLQAGLTRRLIQWTLILLAVAIVFDGLTGPQSGALNLAGVLPWTYWRGFAVIALLAAGNAFCYACPFIAARDAARKIGHAKLRWPRWLRGKWVAIGLLIVFLWAYEAFALWDFPAATAWLILGYFSAAILIDTLFRGASFCQHVCPIGQYHFFMSWISPLEVKARSADVCASCQTHDCLRGSDAQRGCELHLFVPKKSGNTDCTFCLDCARACPHDNIGVLPSLPGADLISERPRSTVGPYDRRLDIAVLAAVLTFGAFANAAAMLAPVQAWIESLQHTLGLSSRLGIVTVLLLGCLMVVPLLLLCAATKLSQTAGAQALSFRRFAAAFTPLLAPIGAAMWAAHFLFHLITGWSSAWLPFQRIGEQVGLLGPATAWTPPPLGWISEWLMPLQFILLDAGVLVSLYLLWKRAGSLAMPEKRLAVALPWLLLAMALWVAGLWIVLQPMEMRGTLMAG